MTTEDMADEDGRPRDVSRYLDRPVNDLNKIALNYYGFLHTVQGANTNWATDREPPAWPGFEQVWIPVDDNFQLSGRLGLARCPSDENRAVPTADCIVILPGLFGDNGITRTRDLAAALRDHGFHVLALELRGHGQTDRRYPDLFYTFGVLECQDLLRVSEWLQDTYPCVRRTGLVGTCWGGNLGMLAAWLDGRRSNDPSISPIVGRYLDPPSPRKHYTAGILAFSALLRWEKLMYETDTPQDPLAKPIVNYFQKIIRQRMEMKHHPSVSGKLRVLIDYEFCRSQLTSEFPIEDAYLFLRMLPYQNRPSPPKMESARVPVLLIHAANDMFASPQAIADLMADTRNPNVAALILRGGGHVGFFPYNRPFTYSLVLNYFDPQRGPAACSRPAYPEDRQP
jgi:predicted alpha/beta-fold hydrolase